MLAYAAGREVAGKRQSSPNALLLVISAHVALLALAMSARIGIQHSIRRNPPLINISVPVAPRLDTRPNSPKQRPAPPIDRQRVDVPVPLPSPQSPEVRPTRPDPVPLAGAGTAVLPTLPVRPPTVAFHHDARLLTPASELRPPYPAAKLASEEEAILQLRLTIDPLGRVTAVDPVGAADPQFLQSARRYIIAHWRYEPASDGGEAVSSTVTVTLRFELSS